MGLLVKHILDHPGGRKSFRRQFPSHLRPYLNRTQLKVSLGHPGDPDFLTNYAAADAQWKEEVALAERKHAGKFDKLTPELINYLAVTWQAQQLELDDEVRWISRPSERKKAAKERLAADIRGDLDAALRERGLGDIDAIVETWGGPAEEHAANMSFLLDRRAPEFITYVRAFHDAQIEAWELTLRRVDGDIVPTPQAPEPPVKASAGPRPLPLLATYDAYAAAQGISEGVRTEWRRYIQHFLTFVGNEDAGQLTRDDVVRWRDHLLETPTRLGKPRMAVTVKDKYLTALRCTLAFAVEEKMLSTNVASDVKVRVPRASVTRSPDFTMDEAMAILRATLETPKGRLSAPHALARRWIPWLCAYTGARVNEISQLRKEDVQQIDGIWIINITPEAGAVKTRKARQVPLHAHVIAQGFLEMVKAQAQGALFYDPSKQRAKTDDNRHFKKVGEKLAQWVRMEVGITDKALKPNHAWRHLFKTLAGEAGIEEKVADAIQGHTSSSVSRRYGQVTLRNKADAIAAFPRFGVPSI